jgi:hypothetical protein
MGLQSRFGRRGPAPLPPFLALFRPLVKSHRRVALVPASAAEIGVDPVLAPTAIAFATWGIPAKRVGGTCLTELTASRVACTHAGGPPPDPYRTPMRTSRASNRGSFQSGAKSAKYVV